MKTLISKVLVILISFILAVIISFSSAEAYYRVQKHGWTGAFNSMFQKYTSYSVLGVSDWVVYDKQLGFKLNPDSPGINSLSILGEEIVHPKPKGLKRIVVLGDSVPVSGDPNFVDLLNEKTEDDKNIEYHNASTPGYTTYQEYLFLKQHIPELDPDIVILAYVMNDNHTFLHEFDEDANMLFTKEAKESLKIHSVADYVVSKSYFLSDLKSRFIHTNVLGAKSTSPFNWDDSPDFNTAWKDYSWSEEEKQITSIHNLVSDNGGTMILVVFPLEEQLKDELISIDPNYVLKPQTLLAEIAFKLDVPCLDLFSGFKLSTDVQHAGLYTDGLHLSQRGHEVSADLIYTFLENHHMLRQ